MRLSYRNSLRIWFQILYGRGALRMCLGRFRRRTILRIGHMHSVKLLTWIANRDQPKELDQQLRRHSAHFRLSGAIAQYARNQIRPCKPDYSSEDETKLAPTKIPPREKSGKVNPHGRGMGAEILKKMNERAIAMGNWNV